VRGIAESRDSGKNTPIPGKHVPIPESRDSRIGGYSKKNTPIPDFLKNIPVSFSRIFVKRSCFSMKITAKNQENS
jgi:hypothetical protein